MVITMPDLSLATLNSEFIRNGKSASDPCIDEINAYIRKYNSCHGLNLIELPRDSSVAHIVEETDWFLKTLTIIVSSQDISSIELMFPLYELISKLDLIPAGFHRELNLPT